MNCHHFFGITIQSVLNMFEKCTMLDPGLVTEYIGFTEKDVEKLCADFYFAVQDIMDWFDGYTLTGSRYTTPTQS